MEIVAAGEGAVMLPLTDPLTWRPRIRQEPDPRQSELFHDGGGLPQAAAMIPEWIARAAADDVRAARNARREWGLLRRLRRALSRA